MTARALALLFFVASLSGVGSLQADDVVVDEAAEEAFFRGVALLQGEAYAEALIEFDTALRLQPDLRRVHYYKAMAHLRVGDYPLARKAADRYSRFALDEGERSQLEALIAELDDLDPGGTASPTEVVDDEEEDSRRPSMDAEAALRKAEEALKKSDCAEAADLADQALRLDASSGVPFYVKGRALQCIGEMTRARSILLAYKELHSGRDATLDLSVDKLLAEIDTALAAAGPAMEKPRGEDERIVLDYGRILIPERADLERRGRREMVQGVGVTRGHTARFSLAGSRAEANRNWVLDQGRPDWVRVRVWGRRGSESPNWFEDAFRELYVEMRTAAGDPESSEGLDRAGNGDIVGALAGMEPHSVTWVDDDGDRWTLRVGRCTTPGSRGRSLVENAPCLEWTAHTGTWRPRGSSNAQMLAAARLSETPGLRTPDFSVSFLGAIPAPSVWHEVGRTAGFDYTPSPGVSLGGGILARFALEGFAWGIGFEASATNVLVFSSQLPLFFEGRLMFYVGARFAPRQPSNFDVFFGAGMSPEANGVYPSVGLRFVGSRRTDRLGRFVISVEPHLIVADDYVTFVPFRISFGGAVGTTPTPIRR